MVTRILSTRPRLAKSFQLKHATNYRPNPSKLLHLVGRMVAIGQVMPVAVGKGNVVVDGNGVLIVMRLLCREKVLVIDVGALSRKKARELRLQYSFLAQEDDFCGDLELQLD